jgi:hypothetical protein
LGRPPRRFAGHLDLRQRQACVVEKGPARRSQFDSTGTAYQELGADLELQVADLPAQGRLGGVKPPLGCQSQASFLSHRNEIAKMTQLPCFNPCL